MMDFLNKLTDYIGISNVIAIILVLVTLFFAGYFYFRTFYRMVYSTGVICTNCKELGDFIKIGNDFRTRILFYNNGRKTLTKNENKELYIITKNGKITNAKVLKGESIDLSVSGNKINIQFDYLDAKNLFIIEVDHVGPLDIRGRISETGKILNTEPRNWVVLNIIFFTISISLLFYSLFEFIYVNSLGDFIPVEINIVIVLLITLLIRFIHSVFFIPDNISSKYLNPRNKIRNEFARNM